MLALRNKNPRSLLRVSVKKKLFLGFFVLWSCQGFALPARPVSIKAQGMLEAWYHVFVRPLAWSGKQELAARMTHCVTAQSPCLCSRQYHPDAVTKALTWACGTINQFPNDLSHAAFCQYLRKQMITHPH